MTSDFDALHHALGALMPPSFPEVSPGTRVESVAGRGMARTAFRHSMRRLGQMTPDEIAASIETFGEAAEWLRVRWDGALPDDLVAATAGLRKPDGVVLRPVGSQDYEAIYLASVDPAAGFRWRFKGETPSPDDILGTLWNGVHAQFIVCRRGSDTPVGLVVAYQAALSNGTVYVAFQSLDRSAPGAGGATFEGMVAFIDFLFRSWPLRKLYAEVPGYNAVGVWGGDQGLFREEGRLRECEYQAGAWWDTVIGTLDRGTWDRFIEPWRTWFGLGTLDDLARQTGSPAG